MITDLKNELLKIAEANKEGFTVKITITPNGYNLTKIDKGFVVAYNDTQNSFDENGLLKCIAHAIGNDKVIGGWFNSDNGKYYFDSCQIVNSEYMANKIAKEQKQIAFYDLSTSREIKVC
jgi:hypothetical protein